MKILKPSAGTYPAYYDTYFKWVDEGESILEIIQHHLQDALEFWHTINEEEAGFRYEEGKWSIKELLSHITDTERIFVFRALSISRKEDKLLPGFDQDAYVEASGAHQRSWSELLLEYQHVKQASYDFFVSLNEEQWQAHGASESGPVNMAAFAYVLPGHDAHHQNIVKERYLAKLRKP